MTMRDHPIEVKMTESNNHLTKVAELVDGKWVYPFASHLHWPHWAQNIAERHQMQSQPNIYLRCTPEDANLTKEELQCIINENRPCLHEMLR
jgi:hypothetical protein